MFCPRTLSNPRSEEFNKSVSHVTTERYTVKETYIGIKIDHLLLLSYEVLFSQVAVAAVQIQFK